MIGLMSLGYLCLLTLERMIDYVYLTNGGGVNVKNCVFLWRNYYHNLNHIFSYEETV